MTVHSDAIQKFGVGKHFSCYPIKINKWIKKSSSLLLVLVVAVLHVNMYLSSKDEWSSLVGLNEPLYDKKIFKYESHLKNNEQFQCTVLAKCSY